MDTTSDILSTNNNSNPIQNKSPTPQSQSPFSSVKTSNSIINRSQKNLLTLWVHADQPLKPDVILNPDCLPDARLGQLLEVYRSNEKSDVTKHLIFKVDHTDRDKENVVNLQVSRLKKIILLTINR